jgi:hypothetical protein
MSPSNDDIARLLAKFTTAGWTHQTGMVGNAINVQPTELGKARMRELADGHYHVAADLGALTDAEILALTSMITDFCFRGLI